MNGEEFKQEPHRWCWEKRVQMLDPKGWDDQDWLKRITEAEFLERLERSTYLDFRS